MSARKKPVVALFGIFAMLIASLMFATSSQAYPAASPATGDVSNTTPRAGGAITVTGHNFRPGEDVRVTLRGVTLGTFAADSSGNFSATVQLTSGLLGEQDITLTGLSSGNVVTIAIDIGGTSTGGGSGGGSGELSGTGVAVIGIAALGLVLLAGGGLLLGAGRRRKVGG